MKSPELALQEALYQRLKNSLSAPVYDAVPDDAPYPFVALGETTALDESAKGESVLKVTATLHIYSQYAGMKEAKAIQNQIYIALTQRKLDLSPDFRIIRDKLDGVTNLREDEATRHSVVRWWYLIEEK
jgi:hypothetical protein